MIDGKSWGKNLISGVKVAGGILGVALGTFILALIALVIYGFIAGIMPTLGLSTTFTNFTDNVTTKFLALIQSVINALGVAGSLIVVVIVLVVFAGFIFVYSKYKKGKTGGNSY